jgi:hypothetical protein
MNKMNEMFLNTIKSQIEEAEKVDPDYELLGITTAFVSKNTEDCRLLYALNPRQIEIKEKEYESSIDDPKVRRYATEFDILLQNFRFAVGQIIGDAEAEEVITDENKFFEWFLNNKNKSNSDNYCEEAMDEFVKDMLLKFVLAFTHQ